MVQPSLQHLINSVPIDPPETARPAADPAAAPFKDAGSWHHIRAAFTASKRRTMKVAAVLFVWAVWQLIFIRSLNPVLKDSAFRKQHGSHSQPSNSSLVIIMGNLRGGEEPWKSLYKNVLDVNSADLALIIGQANSTDQYPNSSLYERAKYVWNFPEYDDWADAIDLINGTSWRETHLPLAGKGQGLFGGVKGYPGSGAIIFMIRWFLSQQLLENPDILNQYERFVITRADHYYQCQHEYRDFDLSDNTVVIPQKCQDYGGYTDRHLIVSRANILDALDIFPTLLQQKGEEELKLWIERKNPEKVLRKVWRLKGLKVEKMKRVMFTCATPFDSTRWTTAEGDVPGVPGLLLKYPKEYRQTQRNCPALS